MEGTGNRSASGALGDRSDMDVIAAAAPSRRRVAAKVTAHEVAVEIHGVPHLMFRRADVLCVQGYIKNIGPAQPIHFIETTTTGGEIVSDYADRALWEEILRALATARIFDERLGEKS